jgi:hypothetical protein
MAKTKISEFDTNPDNNTDINSINIAEGCAPSGINNAIRQLMSDLKEFQTGAASDPLTVGGVATFTAGSASAPAITTTGDTNTGIFFPAADTIAFAEGGAEAMRLDSSGNLGLGVTPSAWSSVFKVLEGGDSDNQQYVAFQTNGNDMKLGTNNFYNGTNFVYKFNGAATRYDVSRDSFSWYQSSSGTAGNAITFTQAMTLDASGNLLVGATTGSARLVVSSGGAFASVLGSFSQSTNGTDFTIASPAGFGQYMSSANAGDAVLRVESNSLCLATASTIKIGTSIAEWARFDSSGNLLLGTTTANGKLSVEGSTASNSYVCRTGNNGTFGGNNFNIFWTGSVPQLWIDNSNIGTISTTSDYRIKRNIQTQTTPALERVMALRPVTYQMADYGDLFKASDEIKEGFIAHEVQEVIPSGAEGVKDEENRIQSLRLDAILAVAVKAIQEQQAIITQLQADVASLKGTV